MRNFLWKWGGNHFWHLASVFVLWGKKQFYPIISQRDSRQLTNQYDYQVHQLKTVRYGGRGEYNTETNLQTNKKSPFTNQNAYPATSDLEYHCSNPAKQTRCNTCFAMFWLVLSLYYNSGGGGGRALNAGAGPQGDSSDLGWVTDAQSNPQQSCCEDGIWSCPSSCPEFLEQNQWLTFFFQAKKFLDIHSNDLQCLSGK